MLSDKTTNVSSGSTKLTIVGGKWTLRVPEGTPGAIGRELTKGKNEGQTVYEMKYQSLSGCIVSGELVESEVGLNAEIGIADFKANDSYTISLPAESRYLKELIKRPPNIDAKEEVSLELVEHPKKKTKVGGPVYNLHVVQGGKLVADHFTEWKTGEDNKQFPVLLHGMPDAVHTRTGWDFKAQDEFLFNVFDDHFKTFIAPVAGDTMRVVDTDDLQEDAEESEDVPF